jgi:hypothetical protein
MKKGVGSDSSIFWDCKEYAYYPLLIFKGIFALYGKSSLFRSCKFN